MIFNSNGKYTKLVLVRGAGSMLFKHILTGEWSCASVEVGFEMGEEG